MSAKKSTKKNFLRNILTTTSALAVIAGASSNAMAALKTTDGNGNATLSDGNPVVNIAGGGNWALNDSFAFNHANNLTIGTNGGVVGTVATIDVNNQGGRRITAFDSVISSIVNTTGVQDIQVVVPTAKTLTLGGVNGLQQDGVTAQAKGDFSAVGSFQLGFGANQATLKIDTDSTIAGTIDHGATNNKGFIEITAGNTATFNGVIGGTKTLNEINLEGAASKAIFNQNVSATKIVTKHATAEIDLDNGKIITADVDASAAGGILKFIGAGQVTGTIGATNGLTKVTANGAGLVQLTNGTHKATTFETNDAAAIIQVANGGLGKLQGNVDATANGGQLKFLGDGQVTGTIGATNALTKVIANGANGTDVVLDGVTKTGILQLTSGSDVQLDNTTTIDTLTIGNVNSHVKITNAKELILSGKQSNAIEGAAVDIIFSGNDSKLTFKAEGGNTPVVTINTAALNTGANDKGKIVLFADGDDGALAPIASKLTIRGQALGGANTLRLVSVGGDKVVRLENEGINAVAFDIAAGSTLEYAPSADVSFNDVTFADAAAQIKLEANGANRLFTLKAHLDPGANNRGTIGLHSNGGNIATLTGNGGVKTLGTGVSKLSVLNVTGGSESVIIDQVDLTNVLTLNIKNGAALNSKSSTAAAIATINIGEVGGDGSLTIDANAAYNLNTGGNIDFKHADSLLKLTNTTGGNKVVTLKAHLTTGNDNEGRLEINSNGTNTLNLAKNAAETIGTAANNRIKELIVSGNQNTEINPVVHAKTITVSSTGNVTFKAAVDAGVADASSINFTAAGNTLFEENVTAKSVDFANNARIVTINAGKTLTTNAITSGAGNGSQIIFAGNGGLTTAAANNPIDIDSIKLGANGADPTLGKGLYTVGNIELANAGGTAKFADGFQLTGDINNGAGAAGTVKFLGDAKVTGALGTGANPVGAVTVAGNNKTLQLGGSVKATSLNGSAITNQDLKFINAADITVDGTVGNAQAFRTIEFSGGGKVTFNGAGNLTAPTTFHFSEDNEVVTNNFDIAGTNITNIAGKNGSKFVVTVAQAIAGNMGTSNAERFGELHVNAAGATNVTLNTANFFAGVTGANAQVVFNNVAGSSVSYLGTGAQKITNANFVQDGQVFGVVNANTVDVRDNRTATFDHATFNAALKMHGNNSTANFASKITIGSAMEANAGSNGTLNFNAGATVNTDIGADGTRLKAVNFAGGDTDINSNIHSDAIGFGGDTVTLQKDAIFNGATTFNGTTVALGQHDLTLKGGDSAITGNTEIKTTVNGVDLGNLVVGAGGKITLAGGGNALKVTVDDAAAVPVDGKALKLIKKDGNGQLQLDLSKLTVEATGAFSKWITAVENGELVLTQESQIEEVIDESLRQQNLRDVVSQAVLDAIEDFEENTPGADFVLQLNQMTKPNIADAVVRTANTTTNEVEKVTFTALADVTTVVNNRISEITNFVTLPTTTSTPSFGNNLNTNNNIIGVSSGDEHDRYGVWGTPFYSKATQKKRKSSSGYKSTAYGGTIGFDVKASDDMLVGMAFSAMNSEIKHKDFKSGDKTKVTSYLFSAYATHQFTNNWFGQGVFSIGSSSSDNKENRRISNTAMQTAQGKYSSMIFSTEVLGGYNHMLNEQFVVTPMFGLNYNRINSAGYKETGAAGTPLLDVNKQASHKLNLVGGVKLTSTPFMANDVAITPEAHAFIRHDVIGKGAKVNAKLAGLRTLTEKAKLQKTFYNIGAGLNAAYGAMDYGVSADANFADKYVGVQGTLKLRVNF